MSNEVKAELQPLEELRRQIAQHAALAATVCGAVATINPPNITRALAEYMVRFNDEPKVSSDELAEIHQMKEILDLLTPLYNYLMEIQRRFDGQVKDAAASGGGAGDSVQADQGGREVPRAGKAPRRGRRVRPSGH